MNSYKALLSVFSTDRVGLISEVTGHLFNRNVNLGDTSFAILGKGGEFTSILEIPEDLASETLISELKTLPGLQDADITLKSFDLLDKTGSQQEVTHRIRCEGEDQPGLLARLSEAFMEFDANIIRLKTDQLDTQTGKRFFIRLSVHVPKNRADNCLTAISNTAAGLGQTITIEKVA